MQTEAYRLSYGLNRLAHSMVISQLTFVHVHLLFTWSESRRLPSSDQLTRERALLTDLRVAKDGGGQGAIVVVPRQLLGSPDI
jgi:hypothetical protein